MLDLVIRNRNKNKGKGQWKEEEKGFVTSRALRMPKRINYRHVALVTQRPGPGAQSSQS
jgi:hypothetical protein